MNKRNNNLGITLVALVITIIVLLILAGVTMALTFGNNGILNRTEQASKEHNKQEAREAMNLKITNLQMKTYTEKQRLPNLQEIADGLCEDEEMEYVYTESKVVASLNKIDVGNNNSIFTKIKKYPYEFEIDSELKLASIDGVKLATNSTDIASLQEEMKSLKSKVAELENVKTEVAELKEKNSNLELAVNLLKNNGNVKLIRKGFSNSTINTNNNTWTNLEQVSLAGNGTGKAIVSYSLTNGETAVGSITCGIYLNGEIVSQDGQNYATTSSWMKTCATASITYDENTKLNFQVHTNNVYKPLYSYSILLIPDK